MAGWRESRMSRPCSSTVNQLMNFDLLRVGLREMCSKTQFFDLTLLARVKNLNLLA